MRKARDTAAAEEDRFAPVGSPHQIQAKGSFYDSFPMYSRGGSIKSSRKGQASSVNKNSPARTGSDFVDFGPTMSTKFTELHPTRLYPYPLEDAQRAATQANLKLESQQLNKKALLDQIKYNQMKRRIEKQSDLDIGNQMIWDAHESLMGEGRFK